MSNLTTRKSSQDEVHITWPQTVLIVNSDFSVYTDRELFETIQNSSRPEQHQAFDEFFNRYAKTLALLLASWLNEPYGSDNAKEIFSEVWEVMFKKIGEFSWEKDAATGSPEQSFLFTTGHYKVYEQKRASWKKIPLDIIHQHLRSRLDPDLEKINASDTEQVVQAVDQSPRISELNFPDKLEIRTVANKHLVETIKFLKKLNALSDEDQTILELRCFFNRSYAEIGDQLGKNEGAVRTKFCRIAKHLRSLLCGDI